MLRLGLRLVFGGGREAIARFLVIACGVMIGVALLLFALSGLNVLNSSSKKVCWQCTGRLQLSPKEAEDSLANTTKYPIVWSTINDYYRGQDIQRYDIALRGHTSSVIPGIPQLPAPGEYYASPALARLIASTPHDQLADRFPGKLVGQIGRSGLSSPTALVAVVGRSASELTGPSAITTSTPTVVSRINDQPDTRTLGPFVTALFIMAVGGLLFAILTLITTSTRLAAARREEKFAALRLLGATPRQINYFAGVDAALSACVGAVLGTALFYLVRTPLTSILSSDLVSFFPEDLTPGLLGSTVVLVGAPCLAALAAMMSLRKVRISPLGVTRRATPKPPRDWRGIPLVLGMLTLLGVWLHNRHIISSDVRADAVPYFAIGFGLTIAGLVIAGPWLTMVINRILARHTRGASSLLASRRLADAPGAAFRPVSVVVVAVFLCTVIADAAPIFLQGLQVGDKNTSNILSGSQTFISRQDGTFQMGLTPIEASKRAALLQLVSGVHAVPLLLATGRSESVTDVLVSCEGLRLLKEFGSCTPEASAMQMQVGFEYNSLMNGSDFAAKPVPVTLSSSALAALPTYGFVVLTDGQPAHLEQLRTLLARHNDSFAAGSITWKEDNMKGVKMFSSLQALINGGVLLVLFVAGCSLTIAAAGGLVERKRSFGLLRVTGASLSQLVRVVLYESAVPLLAAAAIAIGSALLCVRVAVSAFAEQPTVMPTLGANYYLLIAGGLAAALIVLLATLPILAATTRPANVRFE